MRYGPVFHQSKKSRNAHSHICTFPDTTNRSGRLSLSLSLSRSPLHPFAQFQTQNTYLCGVRSLARSLAGMPVAARTLWPNSPPPPAPRIDVCLSVKEASHKEQRWPRVCAAPRANKEQPIPRQLSDSSGNTACNCLGSGHILS